jgi:hypothetical protein
MIGTSNQRIARNHSSMSTPSPWRENFLGFVTQRV